MGVIMVKKKCKMCSGEIYNRFDNARYCKECAEIRKVVDTTFANLRQRLKRRYKCYDVTINYKIKRKEVVDYETDK